MTEMFIEETTFPVRYAETDAMGIVHHASYLVYFEEGRSAYTRARGRSYAEMEADGYFLVVTEVHLRYKKSVRYGQNVTVKAWISKMKSRVLVFSYEILDDEGNICITGETEHICMTHGGNVVKFPESWLAWKPI